MQEESSVLLSSTEMGRSPPPGTILRADTAVLTTAASKISNDDEDRLRILMEKRGGFSQSDLSSMRDEQQAAGSTYTTTCTDNGATHDDSHSCSPLHPSHSSHNPPSLPSSPSREGASSEEDSVAEMDYMSEGSNLSLKGLPAEADADPNHQELLPSPTSEAVRCFLPRACAQRLPPPPASSNDMSTVEGGESASHNSMACPVAARSMSSSLIQFSCSRTIGDGANSTSERASAAQQHMLMAQAAGASAASNANIDNDDDNNNESILEVHQPCLPEFRDPQISMWTASHAANCPTEDRSASLVNLLLQPLPPNFDSETQLPTLEPDYKTLIRLNLWSVIDGHGGGCVATYASEVLLPHIGASISRALGCAIVDRGVCTVNGQLRDANALDLDGLIKTSDRTLGNPNSIHYRSPYERSDSEEEEERIDDGDVDGDGDTNSEVDGSTLPQTARERKKIARLVSASISPASLAKAIMRDNNNSDPNASVSSAKTSVKTAASPANQEALVGTHSPLEVAAITRAITESFLAVDEGWINSIDPVATHQTSCQSNGRWNSGACALVVFTVQRLDWTSVSEPDREKEDRGPEQSRRNTSQNRDAAKRRMLDYAARSKSASSMSTVSSTSSLTTEAVNASELESEITETEGEDDRSYDAVMRRKYPSQSAVSEANRKKESRITPPGGCSCHYYRAHDAVLYTAHVGDCRALLLGLAPPRTIKVCDSSHPDTTDDESSHHSSDETECLSSSDHDADSSEEEDVELTASSVATSGNTTTSAATTSSYMNFPRRVVRQKSSRRRASDDTSRPYIALPPLVQDDVSKTVEFDFETDIDRRDRQRSMGKDLSVSTSSSQDTFDLLPLVNLPPSVRPIDLTTDHSAYNPAEVTAVLRRCNNAPRAISAGVGGGIKRVAGSLAVTRALGDAYLKTPLLSFLPYKKHAPYITGRPEVNCRPLVKDGDKVLILATDGVWERASGEDVLRWVQNFYEERMAEAERRNNRRVNHVDSNNKSSSNEDNVEPAPVKNSLEGTERDLFEKNDVETQPCINNSNTKKRTGNELLPRSPSPPAKRRKRGRQNRISYNVADVIVRRVLNKVRRARNISSLQALMTLPQGRARRSKHDDLTASVVDLSAFVS